MSSTTMSATPDPTAEYGFSPETHPWSTRSYGYQLIPFRGMYFDVKRRLPMYIDDWLVALKPKNWERVIASTIR